jgi:hypothetical protein
MVSKRKAIEVSEGDVFAVPLKDRLASRRLTTNQSERLSTEVKVVLRRLRNPATSGQGLWRQI